MPTPQEAWCPGLHLCPSGLAMSRITLSQPWGIGGRSSAWELKPEPHPEGQLTQQSFTGGTGIPESGPSSHKGAESQRQRD